MVTLTVKQIVGVLLVAGLIYGCASSGETTQRDSSDEETASSMTIHNPSLSLADYLRRVPGVMVQGGNGEVQIRIRGNLSFNTSSAPLFVIDGVRSGHSYSRIEGLVPVQNIHSIEVLKDSEASAIYGMAGSNGVIVIRTNR